MITPGYSLTATERVLPRLALDFTTASLDSRVTVTRALNTATRFNSSGYLETVNSNLPRFDFNPSTLACRGLLIEETRENTLSQSNAFTTSPWQTQFTVASAQNVTGPDNVANSAWTLTDNDATNRASFYRALGGTPNDSSAYTASVFVKKTSGAATFPALEFNIVGGSIIVLAGYVLNTDTGVATAASSNSTPSSAIVQDAGLFWRLCISTANNSTGNTVAYYIINPAVNTNGGSTLVGSTTGSAVFYGAQLEKGAFATSYIPTTTTSLTRNADAVSMTGTNFSSWYNASEGTITSEMSGTGPNFGGIAFDDGTNNNTIEYVVASGRAVAGVKVANASQLYSQSAAITSGSISRYALAYKQSNFAFSANASVLGPYLSGNIPTVNRAIIGLYLGASWYLNGHMRKVAYYPQRLTNAEVQAFSKI